MTYTYDFARRPSSVALNGTNLASGTKYLPFGPMTELAFGNGTTKRMTYDNRYRMATNKLTTAQVGSWGQAFDLCCKRQSMPVTRYQESRNAALFKIWLLIEGVRKKV